VLWTAPVDRAAVRVITNNELTSIEALLGGSLVGRFESRITLEGLRWYGFDGLTFDELRITAFENPVGGSVGIDDLQFDRPGVRVPEPASIWLLSLGACALWRAGRRRRRSHTFGR
jgi:hypothetical protein